MSFNDLAVSSEISKVGSTAAKPLFADRYALMRACLGSRTTECREIRHAHGAMRLTETSWFSN